MTELNSISELKLTRKLESLDTRVKYLENRDSGDIVTAARLLNSVLVTDSSITVVAGANEPFTLPTDVEVPGVQFEVIVKRTTTYHFMCYGSGFMNEANDDPGADYNAYTQVKLRVNANEIARSVIGGGAFIVAGVTIPRGCGENTIMPFSLFNVFSLTPGRYLFDTSIKLDILAGDPRFVLHLMRMTLMKVGS